MKKFTFLFVVAIFCKLSAFAQTISITNTTSCPILIELGYSDDPNDECKQTGTSSMFSIPSGASVVYDFTTNIPPGIPSGSGGTFFNQCRIWTGSNTSCPTYTTFPIGNLCVWPNSSANFRVYNTNCTLCTNVHAGWDYSSITDIVLKFG